MSARRAGLLAGLLAGLALVGTTLVIRLATQVQSLPEVMAEWVLAITPPELFSALLDRLKFAAKPLLYLAIAAGEVAVGGVLGGAWASAGATSRGAVLLTSGVWLATVLLALPLFGGGLFGARLRDGPLAASATILASYAVYGLVLARAYPLLVAPALPTAAKTTRLERRRLLGRLGLGVFALALGGVGWRALADSRPARPAAPVEPTPVDGERFHFSGMPTEVTPTADFYRVSKNLFDPAVDGRSWTLRIDGLVERPMALSYADLLALPALENYYTLECISNEIGGDLIGNASWRGVRLRDLLTAAGVQAGAVDVVFHAADGYSDSLPLLLALHPDTLLAYEMNGEPLNQDHGYPARLLVPGIYGMKNVKWVTRIEVVDRDHKGFWQERGWSDVAAYQTHARIDVPRPGTRVRTVPQRIGGIAFAGDRGISRVEVSLDGGATWAEAELKSALSPYTWQLWSFVWTPGQPGDVKLSVRATDGRGVVQTRIVADPFPDGATGYHEIPVRIG